MITWDILKFKKCILWEIYKISREKLYSWKAENTSIVNIFKIETFLLPKESSLTFILDDIRQTKKTRTPKKENL